ncbi:endopeptidase La [bacterium]|nr:MAG: endopeptidase La [bacterium]
MNNKNTGNTYSIPIIPLPKGLISFPGLIHPLVVKEKPFIRMVNDVLGKDKQLGLFGLHPDQSNPEVNIEMMGSVGIYSVGCKAVILKMLRLPDGTMKFLVQPQTRVKIQEIIQQEPYPIATVVELQDKVTGDDEETALMRTVLERFEKIISKSPYLPDDLRLAALNTTDPGRLADLITANLNVEPEKKQAILEELDTKERLKQVNQLLNKELTVLELTQEIQQKTTAELEKAQREYYLREQLKQIQQELGEQDSGQEIEELRQKIEEAGMPEEAKETALKELERLSRMNPSTAEYTVSRTYLDWLVEMPWSVSTEDRIDIHQARKYLDEDHYDLDEVKERVLEFLAVRKLKPDVKSPILLFVGPPGTGKTSLGMSIARAMGRKFVRISLGGMKDEAEIRGHRRTYVGALPGRIIQGIKRAGSNNPVFMLDEIDKIGQDFRGDPASALLEVLDPEQNNSFEDHYLDVQFDLSKVIFIATANYIDPIPRVLLDRMEMLRLPGYTDLEKVQIAKKHLIPQQYENHGLTEEQLEFTDDSIKFLINSYTREAGLRNLDRAIASICRKTAKGIAEGEFEKITVTEQVIRDMLGPEKFISDKLLKQPKSGVVTGLAWTPHGGQILMVEATYMPGKGSLTLTGSLGDVMKESAQIAMSYIRSQCRKLDIDPELFDKNDIHIHVPAGAIPKDGPSAGITIATAIVSRFLNKPPKKGMAMTGEITLRGDVLPVGGIKEKSLAAHRVEITKILLPKDNMKDIPELPDEIKESIEFIPVETVDQVLEQALDINIEQKKSGDEKQGATSRNRKSSSSENREQYA